MNIYYHIIDRRLNVYEQRDTVFFHIDSCSCNDFCIKNTENYSIEDLIEKISEILKEKNLGDLEIKDLKYLYLEEKE